MSKPGGNGHRAFGEMSLTYAIGDVHGCARLLDLLLAAIERHRDGRPRRLVFLGDSIDRGPDSAGVVARLRALQRAERDDVICLTGNHEDMLTRARSDRKSVRHWIANGGQAVLDSYGVAQVADLDWMAGLPTLHEDAWRYFVHAGLRPGRPVEPEDREARIWIRDEFLTADHDFGKHVVHGHTPRATGIPDLRRHRTNLDTGAVFGGALTAGVFTQARAGPVAYLQVARDGRAREVHLSEEGSP